MSRINHHQRAVKGWEFLIQIASESRKARYMEMGDYIGIHHRAVKYVLALIQDYCLNENLPPLTILIINQSGKPGAGFIAWDRDNIQQGYEKVFAYDWTQHSNPFKFAEDGTTEDELLQKLLDRPEKAREVFTKVKARGSAQTLFRRAVFEAYNGQCAFCGLTFPSALEAAHIIPWTEATSDQKLDVRNGILLCATHHRMFDEGEIMIKEDYTIEYYDPKEEDGPYAKYDRLIGSKLHDKKLVLPNLDKLAPSLAYLRQANAE